MKIQTTLKLNKEEFNAINTILNMFDTLSDGEEAVIDEYLYSKDAISIGGIIDALQEIREFAEEEEKVENNFY